jgi:hypothetical protein
MGKDYEFHSLEEFTVFVISFILRREEIEKTTKITFLNGKSQDSSKAPLSDFPIYWKIELFEMMIVQCERMRFLGMEGIVSFYPHEQKMNEY